MFRRSVNTPGPATDPALPFREFSGRILALKIILVLAFVVIGLRLVQIQVIQAPTFQEIARRQYEARVVLPATRGNIYDRSGRILASNTMYVSFGADPKIVGQQLHTVAERFARVFGKSRSFYLERLSSPGKRFVWLERRVKPEFVKHISPGDLEGVIVLNEPLRMYHYDDVAGQLLGFTDIDNNGLSGIELQFDSQLKGTNGFVIMQRDGLGRRRPSVDYPRVNPVDGNHVELTIDLGYQSIAEDELRKGVERNKARSGLVVILDPATGEVLAMANYPGVNSNRVESVDPAALKNRCVTDMFEPGSVFKIVTASAALEHTLVKPGQKFFAENGKYVVKLKGGRTRVITDTHEYGTVTFQEAVELSSNIVMAKVSDVIGAELLYTTARNFGFGIATGVEVPGEISGELKRPNRWSGTTLNTMAYGYEVGVTPLQLAAAYGVVAADGVLMKPTVIKRILNENNEVVADIRPQIIRRVISPSTSRTLREFFRGVVERGTGVAAKVDIVEVAGKTGTSRKVVDGKYESGSYTASFAGFFPADDPKVVCLVMLDNPGAGGYTGGYASAPIFKAIAEKIVATSERFSKRPEAVYAGSELLALPDVRGLKTDDATTMLSDHGFKVDRQGNGRIVLEQEPSPGTRLTRNTSISLTTEEGGIKPEDGYAMVPDLKNLTIRRARNRLLTNHLDIDITGSGVVVAQNPQAGRQVKVGSRVHVRCIPRSLSTAVLYTQATDTQ